MNQKKYVVLFIIIITIFFWYHSSIPQTLKEENKKTYIIGYMRNIFSNLDVNDVQASLKVWVDETLKLYDPSKKYNFTNKVYNGFDELGNASSLENIAALSLSTYDYLTYKDKLDLEPLCVPEINGEIGIEYYFLVRKASGFNSLKNLKGKNIGMISDPVFITSSLWLDVLIEKANLPSKKIFFNKIETAKKESQLILNLFFENLDACIVSKESFRLMQELNPQIGRDLYSIVNSPRYTVGLICYPRSNKNKQIREGFYDSLLKLHKLTVGKQMFTLLKIGKLVPAKSEYFDTFIDLLKQHKRIIE